MKVAIIGLGQFGSQLALSLSEDRHEVLAVDFNEVMVDRVKDRVSHAVIADARDMRSLGQLGLKDFDYVCVMIGEDFAASLLITGNLQEIGIRQIFCRSINPLHERLLKLMNVENVVQAEALAARQLAKRMGIRGASRHFGISAEYSIVELRLPECLVGVSLANADLRRRFGINLITVKRLQNGTEEVMGVPSPQMLFEAEDRLVVFGKDTTIQAFSTVRKV